MKHPFLAFLFFSVFSSLHGDDMKTTEPSELTTLRKNWQSASMQAVLTVDKKYENALSALKQRFTKENRLKEALEVDAEIRQPREITTVKPTETKSDETQELLKLRKNWYEARVQALIPIKRKYEELLKGMQQRFNREGNLEAALAVETEIGSLSDSLFDIKGFKQHLVGTTWRMFNGNVLEFKPGIAVVAAIYFEWECPRPYVIKYTWRKASFAGRTGEIKFDKNLKKGVMKSDVPSLDDNDIERVK